MGPSTDPFARLAPVSDRYATMPIGAAFNWDDCAAEVTTADWYLVCFRSTLRPEADRQRLTEMDDRAHEEAESAPGFIHYFKGPLNDRLECLSFCVWESRAAARTAAGGPKHSAAVEVTGSTYARYNLEFYALRKRAGATVFEIEPYDSPAVDPAAAPPALTPLFQPAD